MEVACEKYCCKSLSLLPLEDDHTCDGVNRRLGNSGERDNTIRKQKIGDSWVGVGSMIYFTFLALQLF